MRDSFQEAIRLLLSQVKGCDNHGFVHYIHRSFFDNLDMEWRDYCRKHGLRVTRKTKQRASKC